MSFVAVLSHTSCDTINAYKNSRLSAILSYVTPYPTKMKKIRQALSGRCGVVSYFVTWLCAKTNAYKYNNNRELISISMFCHTVLDNFFWGGFVTFAKTNRLPKCQTISVVCRECPGFGFVTPVRGLKGDKSAGSIHGMIRIVCVT